MTFDKLIVSLKNGKKVARKIWNDHKKYYITLDKDYINEPNETVINFLDMHVENDPEVAYDMPWRMSSSDMQCDDWYVVDNEPLIGWECPRCNTINSPYERTCAHCTNVPMTIIKDTTDDSDTSCIDIHTDHDWQIIDITTAPEYTIHKYQCRKCSKVKVTNEPIFNVPCSHYWVPDTGTSATKYKCILCHAIKDESADTFPTI